MNRLFMLIFITCICHGMEKRHRFQKNPNQITREKYTDDLEEINILAESIRCLEKTHPQLAQKISTILKNRMETLKPSLETESQSSDDEPQTIPPFMVTQEMSNS